MNKYTKYVSLDHLNNGEPTLVADVTGYTVTVDYGEEKINGQFIKNRDTKHYLMGEAVDRLHELEEKATPKKPKEKHFGIHGYPRFDYSCPNCNMHLGLDISPLKNRHCSHCGQALDWGEE